jgi:RHS repeat-associated protein
VIANGSVTKKITWDTQGTAEPSDDTKLEEVTYNYNLQNRLAKVTTINYVTTTTTVVAYKYNADGVRVQKIDDPDGTPTITNYLIDAYNHTGFTQVLEESSATLKTYTIGDDILTQATDSGAGRHLLYDGHGSTRQLVSGTVGGMTIHDDFSYDGYGVLAGEWFDADAQNYYLRARWYDCYTGRFNRIDPFAGNNQDPQSLHQYNYTASNPINQIDPSGNIFITPTIKRLIAAFGVSKAIRVLVGIRATYVLGDAYIRETGANPHAVLINRWIGKKTDIPPEDWIKDFMLRPDIVDHDRWMVYEVRRDRPEYVAKGMKDVLKYIAVLDIRYPGRMYLPGTWQPMLGVYPIIGLPGISGIGVINIRAYNAGGGVIAYDTVPREESIVWAMVAAEVGYRVAVATQVRLARIQTVPARATVVSMLLGF